MSIFLLVDAELMFNSSSKNGAAVFGWSWIEIFVRTIEANGEEDKRLRGRGAQEYCS